MEIPITSLRIAAPISIRHPTTKIMTKSGLFFHQIISTKALQAIAKVGFHLDTTNSINGSTSLSTVAATTFPCSTKMELEKLKMRKLKRTLSLVINLVSNTLKNLLIIVEFIAIAIVTHCIDTAFTEKNQIISSINYLIVQ